MGDGAGATGSSDDDRLRRLRVLTVIGVVCFSVAAITSVIDGRWLTVAFSVVAGGCMVASYALRLHHAHG